MPDYDVIIVGSGPSGVSAAYPLLKNGLNVLMIDGGKTSSLDPPSKSFLFERLNNIDQAKWLVGKDFHALKSQAAISPKMRVPLHSFAFEDFHYKNKIINLDFVTLGSLARGGLSNVWGCGVSTLSNSELLEFPFAASDLRESYLEICQRIGVSGNSDDDMQEYFGLDEVAQPPIQLDFLHQSLLDGYKRKHSKILGENFIMGRSRVAALSEAKFDRLPCNLSGNCLWGCSRNSLYSSLQDLRELRKYKNFEELPRVIVDELVREENIWLVQGYDENISQRVKISAHKVILAAGTLASTRIALRSLKLTSPVSLFSNPTAAFLLWMPSFLSASRVNAFGLGQLSYAIKLRRNISAFGSTFSTTGIPITEFARHFPMKRPKGMKFLSILLSSCIVGNIFLPGSLMNAQAKLNEEGDLIISGGFNGDVSPLMIEAHKRLKKVYRMMGAFLLPGSFKMGLPGSDIHYAGTMPMKECPKIGQTNKNGEIRGLEGVYAVDGSCLPSLSEKSHTLTIMANALRIGKNISVLTCFEVKK